MITRGVAQRDCTMAVSKIWIYPITLEEPPLYPSVIPISCTNCTYITMITVTVLFTILFVVIDQERPHT